MRQPVLTGVSTPRIERARDGRGQVADSSPVAEKKSEGGAADTLSDWEQEFLG